MSKRRVIIAGGRDFTDYNAVDEVMTRVHWPTRILSGGAKGADAEGERWAKMWGVPCDVYPAEWDTHGKAAGPIRNAEMADNADVLVAFWDGRSSGTKNMIVTALRKGLEVHVLRY